jgi:hypothetical protein
MHIQFIQLCSQKALPLSMSDRWCSSSDFTHSVAYTQTSFESIAMHFTHMIIKVNVSVCVCMCVCVCVLARACVHHIFFCTHREYDFQAKHCHNIGCSKCIIFSCCSPAIAYFQQFLSKLLQHQAEESTWAGMILEWTNKMG